ncbi:MAG: N-acetylmuramoyl-L-alanine amidase [Butyricicoccus porcorum]|nr:N-acetylmuramoyl-L-alanine amidase [Butyricicoccus porcorum]
MALKRWVLTVLLAGLLWCLYGCGKAAVSPAGSADSGSAGQTVDSGSAAGAAEDTGELIDPPLEEEASDTSEQAQPLAGIVICLDPGHGVTDATGQERVSPLSQETKAAYVSGAAGNSQTEEELNLAVAQLVRAGLEERGAQVVMTRQTNEATVSNIERAQIANNAGADLCIRIHADGSEDSSVSGMSMQVPAGSLLGTPEIEQPSARVAEIILEEVTAATGARSRGLVQRSDLTGFNWSEVPCVLLEMGFLSNAQEDALLATDEYRQQIASGIISGVCRWMESGR